MPAHLIAQIIRGQLITLPRPAPKHLPRGSVAQLGRVDKLPIHAAHGVTHVWLVDPDAWTLEVFALHDGR